MGSEPAWAPILREQVTTFWWCVFAPGHAAGDAPLKTYPTAGQADAFARNMDTPGQVVRVSASYFRKRYEG